MVNAKLKKYIDNVNKKLEGLELIPDELMDNFDVSLFGLQIENTEDLEYALANHPLLQHSEISDEGRCYVVTLNIFGCEIRLGVDFGDGEQPLEDWLDEEQLEEFETGEKHYYSPCFEYSPFFPKGRYYCDYGDPSCVYSFKTTKDMRNHLVKDMFSYDSLTSFYSDVYSNLGKYAFYSDGGVSPK